MNEEDRIQFKNMIILFGELVRSMFSYEKYLKKLISRGDLPMRLSKTNLGNQQDFTLLCKELHTLPRHIQYVLSLPLTDTHKVCRVLSCVLGRKLVSMCTVGEVVVVEYYVGICRKLNICDTDESRGRAW